MSLFEIVFHASALGSADSFLSAFGGYNGDFPLNLWSGLSQMQRYEKIRNMKKNISGQVLRATLHFANMSHSWTIWRWWSYGPRSTGLTWT